MYTTLVDLDIERKKLDMYWPMRTLNTSRKENKRISYPALHVCFCNLDCVGADVQCNEPTCARGEMLGP